MTGSMTPAGVPVTETVDTLWCGWVQPERWVGPSDSFTTGRGLLHGVLQSRLTMQVRELSPTNESFSTCRG